MDFSHSPDGWGLYPADFSPNVPFMMDFSHSPDGWGALSGWFFAKCAIYDGSFPAWKSLIWPNFAQSGVYEYVRSLSFAWPVSSWSLAWCLPEYLTAFSKDDMQPSRVRSTNPHSFISSCSSLSSEMPIESGVFFLYSTFRAIAETLWQARIKVSLSALVRKTH